MPENQQSTPTATISVPSVRNRSTIVVIASGTILVAVTQLIQTFVFWIVNRHQAAVIIHLTPWLALILQAATPIALLGLLAASIGLIWQKQWGRPLFVWTTVVWMLVVALLSYWIMTVVNSPVYLLAIWLLYKKNNAGFTYASGTRTRLSLRRISSVSAWLSHACYISGRGSPRYPLLHGSGSSFLMDIHGICLCRARYCS